MLSQELDRRRQSFFVCSLWYLKRFWLGRFHMVHFITTGENMPIFFALASVFSSSRCTSATLNTETSSWSGYLSISIVCKQDNASAVWCSTKALYTNPMSNFDSRRRHLASFLSRPSCLISTRARHDLFGRKTAIFRDTVSAVKRPYECEKFPMNCVVCLFSQVKRFWQVPEGLCWSLTLLLIRNAPGCLSHVSVSSVLRPFSFDCTSIQGHTSGCRSVSSLSSLA